MSSIAERLREIARGVYITNALRARQIEAIADEIGAAPEPRTLPEGMDTPWPLQDVLATLIEATEHLLDWHNCDGHGHENFRAAVEAGKELLAKRAAQPPGDVPSADQLTGPDVWTCPRCGSLNPPGTAACYHCKSAPSEVERLRREEAR